jgi:hypothetical protein
MIRSFDPSRSDFEESAKRESDFSSDLRSMPTTRPLVDETIDESLAAFSRQ